MKINSQKGFAMPIIIAIGALVVIIGGIFYFVTRKPSVIKEDVTAKPEEESMKKDDTMMQKGDGMMEAMKYMLVAQNKSGETGMVIFADAGMGKTKITVELGGVPKDVPQPAHIHTGSCKIIGGVKYPLTNVVDGKAETILPISFEELWKELPFAVNVHKSTAEANVYVACADVTNDHAMMNGEMMKHSGAVLAGKSAPLLDFNKADYDVALKTDKLVVLYFYANWCPICKAEFPIMQKAFNELATTKVIGFRVNYNDDQTNADETALARQFGVAYQHTKVFVKNGVKILKSPEGWDDKRYDMEINKALGQ